MNYIFTNHALEEMERRGISYKQVELVLKKPDDILDSYNQRKILQSLITVEGVNYLLRIMLSTDNPAKIITVYRTSKIDIYRRL